MGRADVIDACMVQERGVVAWSPQVWKRKVLLDSSTKSSEKPWYNAHLAITPVRTSVVATSRVQRLTY